MRDVRCLDPVDTPLPGIEDIATGAVGGENEDAVSRRCCGQRERCRIERRFQREARPAALVDLQGKTARDA